MLHLLHALHPHNNVDRENATTEDMYLADPLLINMSSAVGMQLEAYSPVTGHSGRFSFFHKSCVHEPQLHNESS